MPSFFLSCEFILVRKNKVQETKKKGNYTDEKLLFFLNEEVDILMGNSGLSMYLQSFLIWCPIYGVPTSKVIAA